MLVSDDIDLVARVRKLSTQARESAPHYQHAELGFNYRMSNLLAAVGSGQLQVLEDRVRARRQNFEAYRELLGDFSGTDFMPDPGWGRSTRWLTVIRVDPETFGTDRESIRLAMEILDIEARPVYWKPMHMQPLFRNHGVLGGSVSEEIFERGLCLPSGSAMTRGDLERVASVVRDCQQG